MADGSRMSDARFLPYQPGDFGRFRTALPPDLAEGLGGLVDFRLDGDSEGWSYSRGGVLRGVGFLSQMAPWRWLLWSFPGQLSMADWRRVIRFTRYRVIDRLSRPGARRIEATADVRRPEASRLLRRLGFTLEGTLRAYGEGGQSEYVFSIVREDLAAPLDGGA